MTNKELANLISVALVNDNDVYHGDVARVIDDILFEHGTEAFFSLNSKGNVVVVEGEFNNDMPIDIRVTFKDDMETLNVVEDF